MDRRDYGPEVVGCSLAILRSDSQWYHAVVRSYDAATDKHLLQFVLSDGSVDGPTYAYDINHPERAIRWLRQELDAPHASSPPRRPRKLPPARAATASSSGDHAQRDVVPPVAARPPPAPRRAARLPSSSPSATSASAATTATAASTSEHLTGSDDESATDSDASAPPPPPPPQTVAPPGLPPPGPPDPHGLVGRRVKVYWALDDAFYYGWVARYSPAKGTHLVAYDDGDRRWYLMKDKEYVLLQELGEEVVGRDVAIEWSGRNWFLASVTGYSAATRRHHVAYRDGDSEHVQLGDRNHVLLVDASTLAERPMQLLGRRISVYWARMVRLYRGVVSNVSGGVVTIVYDDGDVRRRRLSSLVFAWHRDRVPGTPPAAGVVGLTNMGNTCYLNSVLQALGHIPQLAAYAVSDRMLKDVRVDNRDGMQGRFAGAFCQVMRMLWGSEHVEFAPAYLKALLGEKDEVFYGMEQQDAHEAVMAVVDALHEELAIPNLKVQPMAGEEYALSPRRRYGGSAVPDVMHKSPAVVGVPKPSHSHKVSASDVVDGGDASVMRVAGGGGDGGGGSGGDHLQSPPCVTRGPHHVGKPAGSAHRSRSASVASQGSAATARAGAAPASGDAGAGAGAGAGTGAAVAGVAQAGEKDARVGAARGDGTTHTQAVVGDAEELESEADSSPSPRVRTRCAGHVPAPNTDDASGDGDDDTVANSTRQRSPCDDDVTPSAAAAAAAGPVPTPSGAACDDLKSAPATPSPAATPPRRPAVTTSMVTELLFLQTRTDVTCTACKHVQLRPGPAGGEMLPPLPLAPRQRKGYFWRRTWKDPSLTDCLNAYFTASATERGECPGCKQTEAGLVHPWLASLPPVLVVQLKRFEFATWHERRKLDVAVHFPMSGLDMTPYVHPHVADSLPPGDDLLYSLVAVVNHVGGLEHGHYTTFAKDVSTGQWWLFNDDEVVAADETDVTAPDTLQQAYLLFYLRHS